MIDDIVSYLHRSGWAPQSVDDVRPRLPRWETRVRERGVDSVPFPSLAASGSVGDIARAHNELNLLMLQTRADRGGELGHDLRNLTGVRPFEP